MNIVTPDFIKKILISAILLITSLIPISICAQDSKLKGQWISFDKELVEISDTLSSASNNMLSNEMLVKGRYNLSVYGDTLSFQWRYTSSRTNFRVQYIDRYDLKIISVNDSILVLKPASDFSKKLFQNKSILTLKKRQYLVDNKIKFEKIVFQSSLGGSILVFQIDNKKNIYLENNPSGYSSPGWPKKGYYTGTLTDSLYNKLNMLLKNCNLWNLRFNDSSGADGVMYTMVIYFNGEKRYLKAMFPPRIADDLILFLAFLPKKTELTATDEKRNLDW
ncbi:hypothetical protein [Dyadobacter sp. 3J3]|uniref:hypothetical protein n=1 Tax=Dyadobacter sp. 3J3 TaxID=2606600 RepID=UPI00135AD0BF|nr:hypothetical protein [Dyadobacter sp. 3J3]